MKRLEISRRIRTVPSLGRHGSDPAIALMQCAFERHRLQMERTTLARRIRKIEARLHAIAAPEPRRTAPPKPCAAPAGVTEVTLRY